MTDDELRELFAAYGEVSSANVIMDRMTGNSKGFGFVEMAARDAGEKAIKELRGRQVGGRSLNVDEARPQSQGGGGGGGMGGGRGGGRGGGFGGGRGRGGY
jgi:RNA recognition motif-containing protein